MYLVFGLIDVPFVFSMLLAPQLTIYVAHGVTRRTFLRTLFRWG